MGISSGLKLARVRRRIVKDFRIHAGSGWCNYDYFLDKLRSQSVHAPAQFKLPSKTKVTLIVGQFSANRKVTARQRVHDRGERSLTRKSGVVPFTECVQVRVQFPAAALGRDNKIPVDQEKCQR